MWFLKIQSKKIRKHFTVTYVKCNRWEDDTDFVIYQTL